MKFINSEQAKIFDKNTIEKIGIPSLVLMERASLGLVKSIEKNFSTLIKSEKKALVIASTGNNGGDGIAIARILNEKGKNVIILSVGDDKKRSEENKKQLEIAKNLKIECLKYSKSTFYKFVDSCDLIIDAIFGVGLNRDIEGDYKEIIENINCSKIKKVSVDIPSGINSDTGKIMSIAVKADLTVTFGFIKTGLLMDQALEYVGKLEVVDIGIPKLYAENVNTNYITDEFIKSIYPKPRKISSFKNNYGRTLLIGGSESMSGAIVLAAKSALKSGAGLVNVFVPELIHSIVAQQIPTAMVSFYSGKSLESKLKDSLNSVDSIVFGPGIGKSKTTKEKLEFLFENFKAPMVIDADGLNILSENIESLEKREEVLILTPHVGEMARLMNIKSSDVQNDRIKIVKDFTKKYKNIILVLKGAKTIISDGVNIFINSTGNPVLARGGTGDVLSGIIGGLLSQKMSAMNSALLGVYIHGLMGDLAREKFSENSVITEELIEFISKAFQKIEDNL